MTSMQRRRMQRRQSLGSVIQSYKKVLNFAPASRPAYTLIDFKLTGGVDGAAAAQTSPTDSNVPTGSVVKYIEIQYSVLNLAAVACFQNATIQRLDSGQLPIDPRSVGGNPQRNQVLHQDLKCISTLTNVNRILRFKIPKKYQRVREGSSWYFSVITDAVTTDACQVIYKFYR